MNIFKKIYYWNRNTIYFPLLRFFDTKLTKNHLICVKESFNAMPYDYSYLWRVEKAHLIEMRDYFKISHITGHEDDIKYIDICIKLLDILIDDGYHLYDIDKNVFKKYVNIKNDYRFNISKQYHNDLEIYCLEVYLQKVKHLYYEILKNKITNWWD